MVDGMMTERMVKEYLRNSNEMATGRELDKNGKVTEWKRNGN